MNVPIAISYEQGLTKITGSDLRKVEDLGVKLSVYAHIRKTHELLRCLLSLASGTRCVQQRNLLSMLENNKWSRPG